MFTHYENDFYQTLDASQGLCSQFGIIHTQRQPYSDM